MPESRSHSQFDQETKRAQTHAHERERLPLACRFSDDGERERRTATGGERVRQRLPPTGGDGAPGGEGKRE